MDLDIPGPDADELRTISGVGDPGWGHLFPSCRALPRILRPSKAVCHCLSFCPLQVMPTIGKQQTRDFRPNIDEEWEHENFCIPKGVTAIAITAQRLCAEIYMFIMARRGNQKLEQIEPDGKLRLIIPFDHHVRMVPFRLPSLAMLLPKLHVILAPLLSQRSLRAF